MTINAYKNESHKYPGRQQCNGVHDLDEEVMLPDTNNEGETVIVV